MYDLMALAFQVVLTVLHLMTERFGSAGVLGSAAVLGLADLDALTFAMNRLAEASDRIAIAALAITLGVTINGAFKAILAGLLGVGAYRRLALPGLLLLAVAGGAGLWLLRAT